MPATRLVIPLNMSLCRDRFSLVDMAILGDREREPGHTKSATSHAHLMASSVKLSELQELRGHKVNTEVTTTSLPTSVCVHAPLDRALSVC